MEEGTRRRADVFGGFAEEYDRWRPDYPDAAVAWLVPHGARRVADVGAGTGKLTRALVRRGLATVAVEPNGRMLDVLRARVPEAEAHLGGADALPVDDDSLDAVLVAQAWHWFPHAAAVAEVRRTLRPGGWLGLVWNTVAPRAGWSLEVARLDPEFVHRDATAEDDGGPGVPGLPAGELESTTLSWHRQVTPSELRSCLATQSIFVVMDARERGRRLDRAESLASEEARRAGATRVSWPHATLCVRWRPTGS